MPNEYPRTLTPLVATNASDILRHMVDAALKAGDGLQSAARNRHDLTVSQKTLGDFVSDADRDAEDIIARHLGAIFPDFGWVGEESGTRPGTADGKRWIVDPLDGTTNFLKGLPHWAVSIALYQNDTPLCAVVYDPPKGELFSAERGCGAHLNGRPIHVSDVASQSAQLMATGVPSGARIDYLPHCLDDLNALMPHTAGIRRWGAAALDLAYVAAGRFDAYWERNLGPWDIAAGALLVEEAGGQVRPLWDEQTLLASGSFVAGPPHVVDRLLSALNRREA